MTIRSFKQLGNSQESLAGGKAGTLARLYRAGYRVPDGFIILTDAFSGDKLVGEAWGQIERRLDHLRRKDHEVAFAVRSSALSEDTLQASFAGEFETVLDVKTDAQIRDAILKVRRSRHSTRVQAYSQVQTPEQQDHEIAVIVQRLIRAEFSGVLFTVDPLTGDQMHMSGNFVEGLGEKLVSGQANAQSFTFERPKGTFSGPAELNRCARSLYRSACKLEKDFGHPQDIEWAFAHGKLFILQSRPITTLNTYKKDTAEWNDSLRGNFLWSGANLVENAPHVLTPFSCSLRKGLTYQGVDLSDGSSMGLDGYPLAGIIGGRGYMNLSVQVSAIRPFFGGDSRRALEQVTAFWGDVPEDLEIPLVPISRRTWWLKVLPSIARIGLKVASMQKKMPGFIAENPEWCAEMRRRIDRADPAGLLALWRDEITPYSLYTFFIANAAATDLPHRLEKELGELVGTEDANALLSNLSGLTSPLASLGPIIGLSKVARGEMSRQSYMEAYGHRGENEIEYAWPRPLEDPAWLDRQIDEFEKNPVDIEALMARQKDAYEAAWGRFRERYPRKAKAMQKRLEKAARAAHQREAVRSESTRCATVVRAFALRAGELVGIGDDVFILTIDEILALLAGDDAASKFIPGRKETYERYRVLPPYPTILVGRFDPFEWAADANRRSDIYNANAPDNEIVEDTAGTLTGVPGALGTVEGVVRKLERLEDGDKFQTGEILVTTLTNIGWTTLFPRAAAIVTDLGAPLSHAAIVARELGIPAVVGCGDATMRLNTGDRVRVNGGRGLVEILESV
ncbi:MAG: PEP/pyruvate-binding domain-containing protein [Anaerolineales bacterium]